MTDSTCHLCGKYVNVFVSSFHTLKARKFDLTKIICQSCRVKKSKKPLKSSRM